MKIDVSCRVECMRVEAETSYEVVFGKAEAITAVVALLRVMMGKAGCVRWQAAGGDLVEWRGTENGLALSIGGAMYALSTATRELVLGFLLDMAEDYPTYDHMDLALTPSVDLTLRCVD